MERCENPNCGKGVEDYLYGLENRGIIYRFVCERCYFKWRELKQKKHDKQLVKTPQESMEA